MTNLGAALIVIVVLLDLMMLMTLLRRPGYRKQSREIPVSQRSDDDGP
jgi:hypothetical protein